MRVVFMGSPEFAVPCLHALARTHDVALVVSQPDKPAGRGGQLAAPAVKASTVPNIEAVWQEGLITRKRWLKKYVSESVLGADAAA